MHITFFSSSATPANGSAVNAPALPERARVFCWQLAGFTEAGSTDRSAVSRGIRPEADLDQPTGLLPRGCPHKTARRIHP
jgi:hypothetical protein